MTVGAIDERSMYGLHFELTTKTTDEVVTGFIKMVKDFRSEFGKEMFTRVNLDSAGEWSAENVEWHKRCREELDPPMEFIYPPTMIDSRYNAHAEVWMRMIEEMTKAVMLTTRLEIELRPLATNYAVYIHNRTAKRSRTGPDGNGVRPLQEVSRYQVSSEECDRQIDKSEMPGTLMLVKRKHGPKGSDINDVSRWKWGRVVGMMPGHLTLVFEDPFNKLTRFHGSDGVKVVLPPGMSALGYLHVEQPELPKSAMPRVGDSQVNDSKTVIKLANLEIHDLGLTANPISSITAVGDALPPGFTVLDANDHIMEPMGDNNYMVSTNTKLVAVEAPVVDKIMGARDRLIKYLSYMPGYFVGKTVFKKWRDGRVYRGTILEYDAMKVDGVITDEFLWRVKYDNEADDFDFADYEADDVLRYAIDYDDGVVATKASVSANGSVPGELPWAVSSGDGGSVMNEQQGDDKEQLQQGGPATTEQQGNNSDESEVFEQEFWTTGEGNTWLDVMDEMNIEELDDQRQYYDWCKSAFYLGSDKEFNKVNGGFYFPNPIRKQEVKKERKKKWTTLRRGLKFPLPEGPAWEQFASEKLGVSDHHMENVEAAAYLTELEFLGVQCEVFMEFEIYKQMQLDDNDAEEDLWEQVALADMAEEMDVQIDHAKLENNQYFDEKGLPIPPKSIKQLLKRMTNQDEWFEAIDKEHKGLDDRGVMKYLNLRDSIKGGHISPSKRPIPLRLLLSTKIRPDGTLDKLKARAVVSGDQMIKGIHYSMVFTPTPSLTAGKLVQGLAVKDNLNRFACDIDQAFTAAENEKEGQIAVRLPDGMKRYDENGKELYGILLRNLYGAPDAPLLWAKCFSEYMHGDMATQEGWKVEHMTYEPCLWKVTINGRVTWMVVHVDDIDGASEDARDSAMILEKLQKRFGISIIEPKYMLGIQRDISSDEGITTLEMTQVAYIEQAWDDWKELSGRITKKAPTRPADGLKFTDQDGKLIETDSAEYEAVTKRGYRRVVGTILWPARNAYPIISYAVVQLCRAMEKPSERAWESAMHCLHYLYAIRHEGIRFSSKGNWEPVCYYDSGHLQCRVDYKSFYGYVIVFMGAPIHWVSKKHQHVGESSAEDEYMALNHAGKMVVWLRNLMTEMGLGHLVSKPTLMLGDNKQAGRWARTEMITNGNRFIERQYHKVREFIMQGHLEARYINTKLNVSDVFTKDVSREVIETLGPMLTGRAPWPPTPSAEDAMREQIAFIMAENAELQK